ncbi:MAG: DNA mismatch repair endonuclease MutL [Deltaproteobacteria bacterium]|nr:DNA mismatch repair endonuclease MutL [Deltaproteobacteria bacterium]
MSKIRILPENLANQIAAGEVVERPASVVKEFVENAIDAGAGRIAVEVEGGGCRLIRVIDDGEGMDQDDMLLALERHATSKLGDADQLSRIVTLVFRGEAIPSIASVSRLNIISRVAGADLGNCAEIRFGQLRKVHEMGGSPGTVMEVRDLFGNVPARRKFLKSVRTELAHIDEVIVSFALALPQLGFTYSVDGRVVRSFAPAMETLAGRVRDLMGRQLTGAMIELVAESDDLRLHGYLLPPDEPVGAAARLRIFVNRRPVRDRMVTHAVTEGMHNFLLKGRGPVGVLFLELDPELVDVNVHPAKQEIRFQRSREIHQQVVAAVGRAMQRFQQQMQHAVFGRPEPAADIAWPRPAAPPPASPAPAWQVLEPAPIGPEKERASVQTFQRASVPVPAPPGPEEGAAAPEKERASVQTFPRAHEQAPTMGKTAGEGAAAPAEERSTVSAIPPLNGQAPAPAGPERERSPLPLPFAGPERSGRLKYVGQFMGSYLLCETGDGIAVIDQHAAHERLLFETLKKQYRDMAMPSQALLFPEIIECTPEQIEMLQKHGPELAAIGLTIQEFGGQSYVIKAVPAILGHLGPREIAAGIFDHFLHRESRGKDEARRMDDVLAVMACKAAVKAHDIMRPEEGEALLRRMEEADVFSHCPHGRPVLKVFSEAEIKKWFAR